MKIKTDAFRADFTDGRVINIKVGNIIIIKEIYFALRDSDWKTIPYKIKRLKEYAIEDKHVIEFEAIHDKQEFAFFWQGEITYSEEGIFTYSFTGQALSQFRKNRIGLCVLLPSGAAGKRCKVTHGDGEAQEGVLPEHIAPFQPFTDIARIEYETDLADLTADISFTGEKFEMEDQRNWTDNSFKIYSTPLLEGFPVVVHHGEQMQQKITVRFTGKIPPPEAERPDAVKEITWPQSEYKEKRLPSLGAEIKELLSPHQKRLFKELNFSHYRYEVHFPIDISRLNGIAAQVKELSGKILLVVFFTENRVQEAQIIKTILREDTSSYYAVIAHEENKKVISHQCLSEIQELLADIDLPLGSGTDGFFTQLNREKVSADRIAFITYSNNPQVHAFDNESILDTAPGQADNVKSCRILYPGKKIWVTPVTLKMRWNPDAADQKPDAEQSYIQRIDWRQSQLFTAVWCLKSITALAKEQVDGVTWFETVGDLGIMEREEDLIKSHLKTIPGQIFPVYYILWLLGRERFPYFHADISEKVVSLWFWTKREEFAVIGNLLNEEQRVKMTDLPEGVVIYKLTEQEVFSSKDEGLPGPLNDQSWCSMPHDTDLVMEPYAIVFIRRKRGI